MISSARFDSTEEKASDQRRKQALSASAAYTMAARTMTCGHWRADLLPGQPYNAHFTADRDAIGFAFESQSGVHALGSDRRLPFRTRANSLACIPAGCDVFSQSDNGGEYLKITPLAPNILSAPALFNDRIDPRAIAAAQTLRSLLLSPNRADPSDLEHQASILCDCAQATPERSSRDRRASQWMTPARLKRIEDIIESELSTAISVSRLSTALDLSEGFFSRAFKAAIGKSPHDHIIDRRVARCRSLLQSGHHDLTTLALDTGFSSQAHMTSTFRRRLGLSPGQMREMIGSSRLPSR